MQKSSEIEAKSFLLIGDSDFTGDTVRITMLPDGPLTPTESHQFGHRSFLHVFKHCTFAGATNDMFALATHSRLGTF